MSKGSALADQRRVRQWKEKNRHKVLAHKAVRYAVACGRLTKEPCKVCGSPEVGAHHEDYSRRLDVVWLCAAHHSELHRRTK